MKYLLLSTHTPDVCARNHRYFCAINYNKTPGFEVRGEVWCEGDVREGVR